MKKTVACIVCILSFVAGSAFAGTVKEYSAEMVDVATGKIVEKIAVSGVKIRMESYNDNGTLQAMNIVRPDLGKGYILIVEDKSYLEFKIDPKAADPLENMAKTVMPGAEIVRTPAGKESVAGYQAEHFTIATTVSFMGQNVAMNHEEWIAPEFAPLPVRATDPESGRMTEMRNVRKGAPDAALFELPAGYSKNAAAQALLDSLSQGE